MPTSRRAPFPFPLGFSFERRSVIARPFPIVALDFLRGPLMCHEPLPPCVKTVQGGAGSKHFISSDAVGI